MPLSAIEIALLAAQAGGGLFQGLSQGSAANKSLKEQQREFNISGAGAPTRALEMLPLRDKLLHILGQRFGVSPSTFAGAQRSYTPGAGGTDRSRQVYEEMLRRMGYGGIVGQTPQTQGSDRLVAALEAKGGVWGKLAEKARRERGY